MKPTMRKSGRMHATVRVEFHPDRSGVVEMLAAWYLWEPNDDIPERLSRKAAEAIVRNDLQQRGGDVDMMVADELRDADNGEEAREWANEQVSRLWPEWR